MVAAEPVSSLKQSMTNPLDKENGDPMMGLQLLWQNHVNHTKATPLDLALGMAAEGKPTPKSQSIPAAAPLQPPPAAPLQAPVEDKGLSSSKPKASRITKAVLEAHFHLPMAHVAKKFEMCETYFKRICRQYGVERWPYRQMGGPHRSTEGATAATVTMHTAIPAVAVPVSVPAAVATVPLPMAVVGEKRARSQNAWTGYSGKVEASTDGVNWRIGTIGKEMVINDMVLYTVYWDKGQYTDDEDGEVVPGAYSFVAGDFIRENRPQWALPQHCAQPQDFGEVLKKHKVGM